MKQLGYILLLIPCLAQAQLPVLDDYNVVWNTPSKNASESMPVGGGDIGLNVWVEKGDLYFYISRSGTFDEHNTFLKLGRVKVHFEPNPFEDADHFKQELVLRDGYVLIDGKKTKLKLWVDVFQPVVHLEMESEHPVDMEATFESWRHRTRKVTGKANNANSYKWAPQGDIFTYSDSIAFYRQGVRFYHKNREHTVFDVAVEQQGMVSVKEQMTNPLANLAFGGFMFGNHLRPKGTYEGRYQDTDFKGWTLSTTHAIKKEHLQIHLHTGQTENIEYWLKELDGAIASYKAGEKASQKTVEWWNSFWERSFIYTQKSDGHKKDSVWQLGRNYQLFRYMLGCNTYGQYPTKFNGGLFTYDPAYTDSTLRFTPDFRNWGGGTMTAQNQRLVYFPMLKSGDFDMMRPQFNFYLRSLKNAELRSREYWGHNGACFTEQLENFGLPNMAEYGWDRPPDYDPGMQYNAWLEYQWDTVLEFCLMMLEHECYSNGTIRQYLPFIESCIRFFDEHYQFLARRRGTKALDSNGHLVLYPGSAAETYKMAYNANATIAGLKTILKRLLNLPKGYMSPEDAHYFEEALRRIPPLEYREIDGHTVLAPARLWERVNNTEVPQLYPVFPWGIYGIGRPDLETAKNTFRYDPDAIRFRSHVGWKQDNIFAARLGLTDEAAKYTLLKMADSGRRFPAFWGPGFDWVPDHNWGGSGMIGMQEMLMQAVDDKIYLFAAWPKDWNVHFRLHAPLNTLVEARLENGILKSLNVTPKSREKDIINVMEKNGD